MKPNETAEQGPVFGRDVPDAAWRPAPDAREATRLGRFLRALGLPDLETLQRRAVVDPGWFWEAAAAELGLDWQRPFRQGMDMSRGPEWTTWWAGGAFNYAASAVDGRSARDPDGGAIAWEGDDGAVRTLTNRELRAEVDRAARAFERLGIGEGDRVGIYLPMLLETAVVVLALGKLRALYTPIFSGYGADAVAARLADFEARLLITADGFLRRGGVVSLKAQADEALARAPTVEHAVVVRRLPETSDVPWTEGRDIWWSDALNAADAAPYEAGPTDPEAPYMVIYTSGTTGRPKGAVHVHGGFPVKGAQDLAHGFDLGRADTLFWYTDLGWMMGPWAISGALLLGARLVLFEGTPDYPDPGRLWSIAARHGVTHLGLSPTVIRALMVHGPEPVRDHDLSALRVLGSTGEAWSPDAWWWFFEVVGRAKLPIVNYSGGTEVSGGILSGNLLTPLRPCSFGGPSVGVAADVVDGDGSSVRGDVGELVIRRPLPGMTRGFWRDPERYVETYWSRLPGVWVHGDWARVDDDGYWYILGRSDDTLKVAGKRVGPAEVESAAVAHPAVLEAAAVGIPHELKGEAIAVFCALRPGETDGAELRAAIAAEVARRLGKALKPELVVVVGALPKTRSGKLMRRVVRAVWLGRDPGDLSSLADPLAVEGLRSARTLRPG